MREKKWEKKEKEKLSSGLFPPQQDVLFFFLIKKNKWIRSLIMLQRFNTISPNDYDVLINSFAFHVLEIEYISRFFSRAILMFYFPVG